jgi:hypothetical protein
MAKDIKRKIVLEGEKEYSAALKEAQRNLKTLRSELKAETAELGANATAQQKNETRVKSLQKQIKEQEKIVKTYQAALAEVKEKYGDNEEAVAKWEQKLNEARASLATMRNTLEETNTSLQDMANGAKDATDGLQGAAKGAAETVVATKSVADALGDIADIGEGVSGAIEDIFTGMLDTVTDIAEKMWSLISETAERANGWTDTANIWGTDAQTIQQYTKAMEAQGKSFSDLEAIVNKIVYGGKGKKITELLGISGVNYKGYNDWDYAMVVLDKIYDYQQRGKNMTPIYEEIFGGKGATKAIDIIGAWSDIKKDLTTFNGNESIYGLSDEEIEYMNGLWVDINKIETKFNDLKEQFAKGLGMATGTLLVNVEGGLDAIAKFMNAETPEEREQALEDLRKNVEEFFRKVGEILGEGAKILGEVGEELQQSDDPVVHMIGDILTALKDALGWIVEHQSEVEAAFTAIFAVCLMGHLATAGAKLAEILLQIETIKKFKGLELGAAGGAAKVGETAAKGGLAGWAGSVLKNVAGAAKNVLTTPELFGIGGYAAVGAAAGKAMIDANLNDEKLNQVYGDNGGNKSIFDIMTEDAAKKAAGYFDIYKDREKTGSEEAMRAREQLLDQLAKDGVEMAEQAVSLIENTYDNFINENGTDSMVEAALKRGVLKEGAQEAAEEITKAVEQAVSEAEEERHHTSSAYNFDEPEEEPETPKNGGGPKRKKNITGTADAGSMAGYLPEVQEAAEEIAKAVENAVSGPTNGQKAAAEAFWDAYRENGGYEDWQMDALESAFDGQEDMLEKLIYAIDNLSKGGWADQTWRDIEDLPESWWLDADSWRNAGNNNGGITSDDLANFRGLPAKVAAAAKLGTAEGISNIKVEIDGYTAGRLLAPYVSEFIAQDYTG